MRFSLSLSFLLLTASGILPTAFASPTVTKRTQSASQALAVINSVNQQILTSTSAINQTVAGITTSNNNSSSTAVTQQVTQQLGQITDALNQAHSNVTQSDKVSARQESTAGEVGSLVTAVGNLVTDIEDLVDVVKEVHSHQLYDPTKSILTAVGKLVFSIAEVGIDIVPFVAKIGDIAEDLLPLLAF